MKWIRWPGFIGFIILVVIIAGAWLFLIDGIVRNGIEKYGTEAVGAKVELDNVDITLFPLGLELIGLQVTDPERPMINAFEVGSIEFALDSLHLLRRKVIIDKMSIIDVEFGTKRETSGAVSKDKGLKKVSTSSKALEEVLSLPSLDVPDVREVLNREELDTLVLADALKKEIRSKEEEYKKRLEEVPGEKEFEDYEKRIKNLESTGGDIGDVLKGVQEADKIKDDIEDDLKLLKDAKKQFETDYASLKLRVDELSKAPQKDFIRLKEKYSLSSQGIGNMSRLLLGPKIGGWIDKGLYWYEKMGPIVEIAQKYKRVEEEDIKPVRGKGVNVEFKEENPMPNFLIRKIEASLKLDLGRLRGEIENVTPEQEILGLPLTFRFSGDTLKNAESVNLDGMIDHINPDVSVDRAQMRLIGYQLNKAVISDQEELPITLEKGSLGMDIDAVFSNNIFDINIDALFNSVKLNIKPKESSGKITRALVDSLSDISGFKVNTNVKGTLDDYKIDISSDIDDVMKVAIRSLVKDQAATFEKDLKSAVNEKVNGPISDLKKNLNGLAGIDKELASRENIGNDLIKGLGTKKGSGGIKLPF